MARRVFVFSDPLERLSTEPDDLSANALEGQVGPLGDAREGLGDEFF